MTLTFLDKARIREIEHREGRRRLDLRREFNVAVLQGGARVKTGPVQRPHQHYYAEKYKYNPKPKKIRKRRRRNLWRTTHRPWPEKVSLKPLATWFDTVTPWYNYDTATRVRVPLDGTCGYHSFSKGAELITNKKGLDGHELRELVAENEEKPPNLTEHMFMAARQRAAAGEWAENDELAILSYLYQTCIIVYKQKSQDWFDRWSILMPGTDECGAPKTIYMYNVGGGKKTQGVHFDVLTDLRLSTDDMVSKSETSETSETESESGEREITAQSPRYTDPHPEWKGTHTIFRRSPRLRREFPLVPDDILGDILGDVPTRWSARIRSRSRSRSRSASPESVLQGGAGNKER